KEPSRTRFGWLVPPAPTVVQHIEDASRAAAAGHAEIASHDVDTLRAAGVAAEPDVRDGDPGSQIVEAAKEFAADLIVMGTRGRSGLERLLVGSVARKVLHHAPCSVLVVGATPVGKSPDR